MVVTLAAGALIYAFGGGPAIATAPASQALPPAVPCNTSAGACWQPGVHARWQYQLQGSPDGHGGCLHAKQGFINVGVTGTSFASGLTVAPAVFDIDILQDGKCYSPQDYSVLNYAAVHAIHVRGARLVGYISAGAAQNPAPHLPPLHGVDQNSDSGQFVDPARHLP